MLARLRRRHWVLLGVLVLLAGLYALAGFVLLPHYARQELGKFVKAHYGRELTLAELRFNPFTLALDARGLTLPDADGQRMVGFARLHVALELASLWHLGPSFRDIILEEPYLRAVIRRDGALNLADLGKGLGGPQPARKSEPLRLFIDRLSIAGGTVLFEDRRRAEPFQAELKPIGVELRNFSTTAHTANTFEIQAASPQGERLAWHGSIELDPLDARGAFELANLKIETIWSYLGKPMPIEFRSGDLGLRGEYELTRGGDATDLELRFGDLRVARLALRPLGAESEYVELPSIDVTDTRVALLKRTVTIGKVILSGGQLNAWLDKDGLNLLDLTRRSRAPGAAESPGGEPEASPGQDAKGGSAARAAAWRISAPDIEVQKLRIRAEDRRTDARFALDVDPLDVHIHGFDTQPDARMRLELTATLNRDATLAAGAEYAASAGTVTGTATLKGLALPQFQPYLAQSTSISLLDGSLGAQLRFGRAQDGALQVGGDATVSRLRIVDDRLKQDLLRWRELKVSSAEYTSKPAALRIAAVSVQRPYARVIIAPDRTVNVSAALRPPGSPPPVQETPPAASSKQPKVHAKICTPGSTARASSGLAVALGKVTIADGSANYADYWIQPNFAVGIEDLSGSVTGLASDPAAKARIELDGKVDRYAPVTIRGEVNPFAMTRYADVKLAFQGLELTTVTPYSQHFAGYKIDKGKLSVELGYQVKDCELTAEQRFVVDQLQLGEKVDSPDAVKLPLRLAVALLKDRNGVIDLGLPIHGSLDDPQFALGPLIWKAFVHLMEKAVTAPFALLSHMFGGGEDINLIDFDPGSAVVDSAASQKLAGISKALKERPQLQLDVPITAVPEVDRPQLAAQGLERRLRARAGDSDPAALDPQRRLRLTIEEFRGELGRDAALPPSVALALKSKDAAAVDTALADLRAALLANIEVRDTELQALGLQRAQAIQDAIVSDGVPGARVFVVNSPAKPPAGGKVRVEVTVK